MEHNHFLENFRIIRNVSEIFGRLRKESLRVKSCRLLKPGTPVIKLITPLSQKKVGR